MPHTHLAVFLFLLHLLSGPPGSSFHGHTPATAGDLSGPLINVAELKALIDKGGLVLLDMGPEKEVYDEAHLPGAIFVDWVDDITDLARPHQYMLVDRAGMQRLLRRLGIDAESQIVLYDDMHSRVATRMYWSLKYYGVTNVQILNGGRERWIQAGYPLTATVPQVTPTQFRIPGVNRQLAAGLDFIADRLQDPAVGLVDGRPAAQFSGAQPGKVFHTGALHEKRGHIPGAVNIFWQDNFNEDGTFKSIEQLEKLYESVTGSDLVVTYCNEGLHAAPAWFVLSELLGHGNVRLYDESMSEWANSDKPVERSDGSSGK
jgi:thiosulfate/3-mercaptopyruvate sulfurtransferase